MELLKHAAEALQRYFSAVVLYLAILTVTSIGSTAFVVVMRRMYLDAPLPLAGQIAQIGAFVLISLVIAIAQTLVFSRLGREIDRPLWKIRDDREAFQRFFMMWFEFNLIVNTLSWIAGTPLGGEELQSLNVLALFATLGVAMVLVPFGAAQMFLGKFSWATFAEGLAPLAKRPMEVVPIFLLTFFQFFLVMYVSGMMGGELATGRDIAYFGAIRLVSDLAIGYLDCLVFAAVWLACKQDRDSPDEVDLDF